MAVAPPRIGPATVAGLLRARAAESPDREAYLFLVDGEVDGKKQPERLTWGDLDRRALAIASALRESLRPGERALLLYPPGLDFVAAFFGCLYAGVVAVPAYPPRPHDRSQERLRSIARDAEPRAALTTRAILAAAGRVPELAAARWIATDDLSALSVGSAGADLPEPDPASLAFLQYTSGSTAAPKGVMVTHANLLHNEAAIGAAFQQDPESVVVGWLPLYHDMGLIGNVLQPLHAGARCVLMAPAAFLQRPRRWLEAISRFSGTSGGTTSGGPNFAYELCVRRIPPEQREGLDLRSWRVAYNGAEPVRAETLARFAEAFAPCGFDPAAFYPCYGLAEATLFVSGGAAGCPPRIAPVGGALPGTRPLVSSGHAWGGQRLAIADPETGSELPAETEGEIWIAGPSVAAGYWRNPEATERDFRAHLDTGEGPFLRTGDLGVLTGGELFVTGRIKDLVILRGRNHYPQDLERTAEAAHPELRPGGAAAFAVEEGGSEERLVIVAEVERRRRDDLAAIAEAVRRAIAEEHEVMAGEVVLVRPGGVPKTSSGKVRRSACRAAWQAGELPVLERSAISPAAEEEGSDAALDAAGLATLPAEERHGAIERFVRNRAAAALGIAAAVIDPERPLTAYGLDSLAALDLKGSTEAALGLSLPLGELLAGAGTARLADVLAQGLPERVGADPEMVGTNPETVGADPESVWDVPARVGAVPTRVVEDPEPVAELSFGERALWFLDRLAPTEGAYNIAVAARVHGDLDTEALRRAFAVLTDRHEALRTVFPLVGDAPARLVLPVGTEAVDFREVKDVKDVEALPEWLAAEAWRPFDLAAGPLLRVRVVNRRAETFLLLCVHHLVADFSSLAVMARDLAGPGGLGVKLRWVEGSSPLGGGGLEQGGGQEGGAANGHRPSLPSVVPEVGAPLLTSPLSQPPPAQGGGKGTALEKLTSMGPGGEGPTDFARWQAALLASPRGEALWESWRQRLAGVPDLDLPTDRPRPPVQTWRGVSRAAVLPAGTAAAARSLAAGRGATLFAALLAAFQAQLGRYAGQDDFAVGTPTAGRGAPEWERTVGYLVNPVALRADLAGEPDFGELVERARRTAVAALEGADFPFALLAERLRPARDPARPPIFQVLLALHGRRPGDPPGLAAFALREDGARLPFAGLELESVRLAHRPAQFEISLSAAELPDGGIGLSIEVNADLFDGATAERMLGHFRTLLTAAAADPAAPLSTLPLLTAAERAQLAEWNDTAPHPPAPSPIPSLPPGEGERTLHGLVAAQAARTPEAEAIVGEEERVTYGELLARAGRVAAFLRGLGAGPEERVGLCLRRTPDMIAALLGILQTGAAYVPLDPAYPQERLDFMLSDSGAGLLWTEKALADRFAFFHGTTILAEEAAELSPSPGGREGMGEGAGGEGLTDEGLAYVIYTSGSTGRPKGVGIEHRSAVALVEWALGVFAPEELRGVLAATSVCFDLSIFEIFVPLAAGGRVILAPDVLALPHLAARGEVTLVNTVPSPMGELVHGPLPAGLRTVCLAGEALKPELVERVYAHPQIERVVNLYGPSEDTTYSTWTVVPRGAAVTIGRPIAGTRAWVLGRQGEELPVGVPGELCLGGAGLARGYLGRPELTAERFVPDPFGPGLCGDAGGGSRLYRTGDRARLSTGGALEFLGRLDRQVKVRGFRIELGEIEAALESCPAVAEAAVVLRADGPAGEPQLVGYLVVAAESGGDAAPAVAAACLRERLPAAFIPSAWVVLDAFPRSPNGKVDRAALARLAVTGAVAGAADGAATAEMAPRTPVEEILAGLFAALLGRERVGIHEDFFSLGGHSLLAARAVSRISRLLGADLPISALFQAPTVAALAKRLAERLTAGAGIGRALRVVPSAAGVPLPLSFGQQRLWFLDRMEPGTAVYNMPGALDIGGPLPIPALAAALSAVVARHEPLRTVYAVEGGGPVQQIERTDRIVPPSPQPLPVVDLAALPAALREAAAERLGRSEAQAPFDLARGPLCRALLLRLEAEKHRLLLTLHHIAADGWSLGLLLDELAAHLGGLPLPALPVRYADWAAWQRAWMESEEAAGQIAWWRERLTGLPVLDLPADHPRPAVRDPRGGSRARSLPAALEAAVARLARQAGCTVFMVLLGAFQALLARFTGEDLIPVGSPVANRLRLEAEPLIGLFVNTLVLAVRAGDDPAFEALLARVRLVCLGAYAHQEVPFERLVQEMQPERALGRNPLFQVMLVLDEALPARSVHLQATPSPIPSPARATAPRPERERGATAQEKETDKEPEGREGAPLSRSGRAGGGRTGEGPGEGAAGRALTLTPRRADSGTARFDLLLAITPAADGGWELLTEHAAALFEPVTIDRLLGHFATLLAGAVVAPEQRLSDLPMLTAAESAQLTAWNWPHPPAPSPIPTHRPGEGEKSTDLRLHDLVAAQAVRTPDAEAIVGAEERITYRELMARAGRVADILRGVGVGPEVRVGLCLRRTPDMIAAILGVLAAGGAYVPLDPGYPQERLDFMLTDSGAGLLWTERSLADRFAFFQGMTLLAEELSSFFPSPGGWEGMGEGAGGEGHLAYIIYTSGSTGRPKGVGIEHRSAVAMVEWALGVFPPEDLRGVLAATSVCFDLSIFELFVPLAAGGRVILAASILDLPQLAARNEVTLINTVPSPMAELVRGRLPESLRTVNLAGEALQPDLVEKIYAHRQVERVVNLYGPSEDTTYSTWTVVPRSAAVTIGRPVAGTQAWVLGRWGERLPAGAVGELCLGGAGLARGYLGRPELTAERFVPDPFSGGEGARLYRTGDRVRLRSDGEIEFLGRFDHQVKLRGQRIELGEIEVRLASCPAVAEAAVMMRTDDPEADGQRLVGYLVPAPESGEQSGEESGEAVVARAEAYLRERLPTAMVPTAWVVLPAFPRSPNGKIDRRALPAPERREWTGSAAPRYPRNPMEELLAGIFREMLGLERVGIDDNFFALGGHSLLAVRMAFRITEACGFDVPVAAIFAAPTVAGLAAWLAQGSPVAGMRSSAPRAGPERRLSDLPVLTAAERAVAAPRNPLEESLAGIFREVLGGGRGLERIGIHDNLFELGAHSLLAVRLAFRIAQEHGVEVPVSAVFAAPTVAGLAAWLEQASPAQAAVEPAAPEGGFPLSSAQQRLWFLDQLEPGSSLYNLSVPLRLRGSLDVPLLDRALAEIIRRHEPLRTVYAVPPLPGGRECGWERGPGGEGIGDLSSIGGHPDARDERKDLGGRTFPSPRSIRLGTRLQDDSASKLAPIGGEGWGEPVQVVLPPDTAPPLLRASLAGLPEVARPAAAAVLLAAEAALPFDLRRGPVVRFVLIELGDEEHWLAATFHHIAADGWSLGLFSRELAALYEAFAAGRPSPLTALPVRYADVALRERRALAGGAWAGQLADWRDQLAGIPVLELPADRPRPLRPRPRGASRPVALPESLAASLAGFGHGAGATLFMVLLTGFTALLARLSGQDDFGIGVPVAGRSRAETENLIGLFVNTLVMRTRLTGDPSFLELLLRVRDTAVTAQGNQDVPFEKLVEELPPERTTGASPLFQVMLAFLSDPAAPRLAGLSISLVDLAATEAKFDLTLSLHEREGRLEGSLDYRTDLFDAVTVDRMAGHLVTLLAGALAGPERRVSDLPLLKEAEQRQITVEWTATEREVDLDRCLHELVAAQAARTPELPAVVSEAGTLSYRELDERAARLARHLRGLGVGPEVAVGLHVERSADWVIAVLAVLKAGGAWLPLDPEYPVERLAAMLEAAAAPVVLTQSHLAGSLPPLAAHILRLDAAEDFLSAASLLSQENRASADNLACLFFTSGSTGRPKGVAVPHRGLVNRLLATQEIYRLGPGDTVLLKAAFGFDFSVWECFAPLIAGARLLVARPGGHRDAGYLVRAIVEHRVTLIHFVPSMLGVFLAEEGVEHCVSLRQVFVGGEKLTPELRDRFFERLSIPLENEYGPTEISIDTTRWVCRPGQDPRRVPIGRPIANTRLYLLDRALRPVPVGVTGEICVAGVGVTRGYLGRPDLTAERFLPDLLGEGGRMYRTGDLGRWLPDGNVDFLGRADQQVKVRGVRIEPAEVEAALLRHPAVAAAAVVADGIRLIAYWVERQEAPAPSPAELREALRASLPETMIPSLFVRLDRLPLTPSGKLDRRALPAPEVTVAEEEHRPPAAGDEELLAAVWSGLLGVERVGLGDSFFDLGGHSLLAAQLASRVRAVFAIDLPLSAVFEAPGFAAFAHRVQEARRAGAGAPDRPPLVREGGGEAPLSFSQQRLWFLHQLEPDSAAYHVPGALRLRGPLDLAVLARTLGAIVHRHEALRTVFSEGPGGPVQVILPPASRWTVLPIADLAALPGTLREMEAQRLLEREADRPFDLDRGPLLRVRILRLGAEDHLLVVVMHHIVSDAWSLGIVLREMTALYEAFAAGEGSPLPELPIQYPDFARWQRRWLTGEVLDREIAHWRRVLAGAPEVQELPYDRPRPAVPTGEGGHRSFVLSGEDSAALRALGRREGWTLFMTLLAGFQALLTRSSGQEDAVIGSPIANRNLLETEGLIGFFTNTLALRLGLAGDPAFREIGRRVRAVALDAYAHEDLPFEKLVEELAPERQAGLNPIFQVMLVVQRPPIAALALPGVAAEILDVETGVAKFDLTLFLFERPEGAAGEVTGVMEYSRDLFDAATIDRLLGSFRTLLQGAVASPGRRLSRLPLLSLAEREELIAWIRPLVPHPAPRCVHDMVAEQAALHPEAEAVVCGDVRLTFRELTARARRLARRLAALGVGPDVPVGIFLERSADLLVSLLAVLEAGGAYLPLDPSYPRERLRLMLEDAGAPVVLTDRASAAMVPGGVGTVVMVDEGPGEPGEDTDAAPLASGVTSANLVYIVYTSGSTGRPKGVAMTHAAITALLAWQLRTSVAGSGRTLQFTSLSFDVSFQEIFSAWAAGGAVVMVSEDVRRDPPALLALLAEQRVERLFLPFVALQQLAVAAVAGEGGGPLPASLREVMSAGEQLYITGQMAELFSRLPGAALYNHYGPSETHAVTWLALTGDPFLWPERPTIGGPVDHARIFLLDRWRRPVPGGVTGEIWVGGDGLARGYQGRPDLTAERFVPDPFDEIEGWRPGDRLYCTGDLARRLPDGTLEFLGRGDAQVKVRGQRIEPAEVETALARHPAILQAAVVVLGDSAGARRLMACLVFREEVAVPAYAEIKAFLAETLPDPMIPSAWVRLDALPLTPSGKLDRRALERISPEETHKAFEPPRTPAEEILAGIWRDVLGVERVDRHDDFFDLGGHSLLATQVASRLREAFRIELPLRRLFEAPTLEGMAAAALAAVADPSTSGEAPAPPLRRAAAGEGRGTGLPLSFAQERLWFLDRLQAGAAYDIPLALRAAGRLDAAALAAALAGIVRRHEVLRTVYADRDGSPVQIVLAASGQDLPVVDLGGLPETGKRDEAERLAKAEASWVFDLTAGPLLRTVLIALEPERHLLLVNMHHIVSDGWSLGILVREIKALYGAALRGEPSPLPELAVQYTDFAQWQRGWLAGEVLERQLAWWRERLAGAPAALEIPAARPRPPVQSGRGAEHRFGIGAALAGRLAALGREEGATPFMVLAAGLCALLARLTGQRDLVVGSPIANRNRIETEELIGFFVNSLVLRADLSLAASFRALLRQVRESSLGAYAHQDLPFEKLVEELHPARDLSRSPLFQVSIALQNAPLPAAELEGLTLAPEELPAETVKLDLSFVFAEIASSGGLAAVLQYATDLFDATTAARLAGHLEILLAGIAAQPRARLAELSLLSAGERHQVLAEWNDTRESVEGGTLLHQLFEAQADRCPEALALVSEGVTMAYGELEASANRLARLLVEMKIGGGEAVGIWMDRSADLVTAVLAVLKAGGTYVPLDPAWPAERAEIILAATGARAVLTRTGLLPAVQEIQWRLPRLTDVVCLDVAEAVPPAEPLDLESVRGLWDFVSASAVDQVTAGGFVSSFTGKPFSEAEVEEYRQRVLGLAEPWLRPEARVLEIGCGAGLILWEMAGRVTFCAGLDPSPRTQERNREHAEAAGITNVELAVGFAHEAAEIFAGQRFDLIVLASTVQFFPGPLYLEQVVREALGMLAPGGALLIADVPDARRQPELRRALAEAGAPVRTGRAPELWLDEDLFRDLPAEASVLHRTEGFANELRCRYDVLMMPGERREGGERRKRLWTAWHVDRQSTERPSAAGFPEAIAYVIHTSGSTGEPKGIAVQHAPAVELVRWVNRSFGVGPGDRLLFITSPAFDLSVWDIFGTLGAGAALRIAPEEALRDPQRLARLLREEPVTIWDSAPAALQQLAPLFPEEKGEDSALRLVLLSGDWIPVPLPDRIHAAFPVARVISLGGATEATVWSNWYPIGEVDPRWPSIPYGRPIANACYHVLDEALQPCPIGVPGDLLIGGRCLAVGYTGQPDLTAEQFVPDPFAVASGVPGARLYRTGDRARHGRDGNLEFLGRRDQQVKVRGFRIELGEIEVALARHPAVREAVVVVREENSGEKRLVGYVVPAAVPAPAPATAELRAFLRETLPEYMVPWTFVALAAMPVTANGKLDRAALPAPPQRAGSAAAAVAPRNALERDIAAAWREILGVESIGVEDNFFEVGGSSLLLGKLQARLRRSLGRDVAFVDLFRHPTIESLARSLAEAPAPAALAEQARARTDTRRERMGQLQKRRKR